MRHHGFTFDELLTVEYGENGTYKRNEFEKDTQIFCLTTNLVTMENLCFVPDAHGIEAVVQDQVPSPEVKDFLDKAIFRISQFLQTFTPDSLVNCKLSVGHIFHNFSCFDETNLEHTSTDPDSPEEEDIESYAIYPLKKYVVKGDASYTIKSYPLAQLAVEILSL